MPGAMGGMIGSMLFRFGVHGNAGGSISLLGISAGGPLQRRDPPSPDQDRMSPRIPEDSSSPPPPAARSSPPSTAINLQTSTPSSGGVADPNAPMPAYTLRARQGRGGGRRHTHTAENNPSRGERWGRTRGESATTRLHTGSAKTEVRGQFARNSNQGPGARWASGI